MTLKKLLDLLTSFLEAIKLYERRKVEKELGDATENSLEQHDQRELEEALGGSSGLSSLPGVFERDRKTKE